MSKVLCKRLFLLTILIVSSISSLSVSATSSVWKVSKGNDYIFVGGTVHLLPPAEFPLPKEFEQAYKQSDAIVLETKLPDGSDMNFQITMMQKMAYENGKKITDNLSRGTEQKLRQYVTELGADLALFEGFKPGFLVTMLSLLEAQKAGLAGEGVDIFYSNKAKQDNKKIEYFESPEFQMNMIAGLGIGNEDRYIQANLAQMKDFKNMFTKLLTAWRQGNERQLTDLAIKPMKKDPASLKSMLTDRNKNWVNDIHKMFADNDKEFVLVGVAHLIGDNSVLALLKAQGYQVKQL